MSRTVGRVLKVLPRLKQVIQAVVSPPHHCLHWQAAFHQQTALGWSWAVTAWMENSSYWSELGNCSSPPHWQYETYSAGKWLFRRAAEYFSHRVLDTARCYMGCYWSICRWNSKQHTLCWPLANQGASAGSWHNLFFPPLPRWYTTLKKKKKKWNGEQITFLLSKYLLKNYRETMWYHRGENGQWNGSFLCRNSNESPQNWDSDLKIICVFHLLKNAGQLLPAFLLFNPG